jgi:acetyl-CoA acetyltransferase
LADDEGLRALRDRTAIAGVGYAPFTKNSGRTPLSLALEAILAAVDDAGLEAFDIDGIATHHVNDSAPVHEVAAALGLRDVPWYQEEFGGGSRAPAVIAQAALAVAAGATRYAVVYRALNGRSGLRMGASGGGRAVPGAELQYQQPYGLLAPSQSYALGARMHMERYGTTSEQLGAVALQQRAYAEKNERALMQTPLTMAGYLSSRMIADPFRLFDCCLETDGACAVVLTTRERAADLAQPVVTVRGWASVLGPDDMSKPGGDLTRSSAALTAPRLYSMAGVGPAEVDVAELYDAFSFSVLVQLEDFGFCAKGDGGPFVASGATAPDGALPVNTHGGFLSEGYVHGLNHVTEAVSQLRGQAGARQVRGAAVALCSAQPGYITGTTSALMLARQS